MDIVFPILPGKGISPRRIPSELRNHFYRKNPSVLDGAKPPSGARTATRGAKNLDLLRNAILALIEAGRMNPQPRLPPPRSHRSKQSASLPKPRPTIPNQPIARTSCRAPSRAAVPTHPPSKATPRHAATASSKTGPSRAPRKSTSTARPSSRTASPVGTPKAATAFSPPPDTTSG